MFIPLFQSKLSPALQAQLSAHRLSWVESPFDCVQSKDAPAEPESQWVGQAWKRPTAHCTSYAAANALTLLGGEDWAMDIEALHVEATKWDGVAEQKDRITGAVKPFALQRTHIYAALDVACGMVREETQSAERPCWVDLSPWMIGPWLKVFGPVVVSVQVPKEWHRPPLSKVLRPYDSLDLGATHATVLKSFEPKKRDVLRKAPAFRLWDSTMLNGMWLSAASLTKHGNYAVGVFNQQEESE